MGNMLACLIFFLLFVCDAALVGLDEKCIPTLKFILLNLHSKLH